MHRYPYRWTLKDANFTKDKGKVFSCFSCGGGSTMGYKLAGFDVIGCNEIDPKMMEVYRANHNPKYSYLEPIQTFKNREDLPEELFNLDILDGSPPCSSFSMAGNREADWGKEKKFREGQAEQVLDTLFFDFIDLAERLQPKVVIAENVKGLLQGGAVEYVDRILKAFDKAGYRVDYKLLDASKMGVPQRRERVFFYAVRKDLECETIDLFGERPYLDLEFNEYGIPFGEFYIKGLNDRVELSKDTGHYKEWENRIESDCSIGDITRRDGKDKYFTMMLLKKERVAFTYTSHTDSLYLFDEWRKPNKIESCCIGTFPQDYNFLYQKYNYIIGMSVPPVMTAQIADRVYEQFLKGER